MYACEFVMSLSKASVLPGKAVVSPIMSPFDCSLSIQQFSCSESRVVVSFCRFHPMVGCTRKGTLPHVELAQFWQMKLQNAIEFMQSSAIKYKLLIIAISCYYQHCSLPNASLFFLFSIALYSNWNPLSNHSACPVVHQLETYD